MQVNKNRQVISLQETLAYIKYINRQRPFNKQQILIPTKDYEEIAQSNLQKSPTPKQKMKKIKIQTIDDEDLTKKINKNRAIKRIIQSAFQILQNFKHYEQDPQEKNGDKSSDIQFNIYLKQYNRVLQMIYNKQKQRLNRQINNTQNQQELLQSVYQYTVVQDFREILPVAILKDKISKNNVQIMINALTQSLVVLRSNQLRVYDSQTTDGSYKTIKLHQIQNVDYHTQPYIFIVLTIQKDKQRFNIYLRFQSQKNQEKWDRALYCCYIGRKMKTKQKFFLLQYPEEDVKKKQKEQTKKLAAFNYDLLQLKKQPLDKIYNEGKTASISSRKEIEQQSRSRSNTQMKNLSVSKSNIKQNNSSKQQQQEQSFPVRVMERTATQLGVKNTTMRSLKPNESQAAKALNMQKESLINRNKTDNIQINKSQQLIPPVSPNNTQRNNVPLRQSPFQVDQELKDKLAQQKQSLPEDIRRIHDIQRKNVKGILLEKQRFFFNKAKMLYLKENRQKNAQTDLQVDIQSQYQAMKQRQIEYWDFDSKSGERSQRKLIKIINITKFELKQQKALSIVHQNNKEIIFIGNILLLKQVLQWITLLTNIYKTKLIPNQIS